jgi:hypothetical protein
MPRQVEVGLGARVLRSLRANGHDARLSGDGRLIIEVSATNPPDDPLMFEASLTMLTPYLEHELQKNEVLAGVREKVTSQLPGPHPELQMPTFVSRK